MGIFIWLSASYLDVGSCLQAALSNESFQLARTACKARVQTVRVHCSIFCVDYAILKQLAVWQAACNALRAETLRSGCRPALCALRSCRLSTHPAAGLLPVRSTCSAAGAGSAAMSPEELQEAVQQIVPKLTGMTYPAVPSPRGCVAREVAGLLNPEVPKLRDRVLLLCPGLQACPLL